MGIWLRLRLNSRNLGDIYNSPNSKPTNEKTEPTSKTSLGFCGLGPGPGWGPSGPDGPLWVLLDRSWQVRTCPISDFWSDFACFGFKIGFLTKFLDDSAWFLLEKLKKHIILSKKH